MNVEIVMPSRRQMERDMEQRQRAGEQRQRRGRHEAQQRRLHEQEARLERAEDVCRTSTAAAEAARQKAADDARLAAEAAARAAQEAVEAAEALEAAATALAESGAAAAKALAARGGQTVKTTRDYSIMRDVSNFKESSLVSEHRVHIDETGVYESLNKKYVISKGSQPQKKEISISYTNPYKYQNSNT